MVETVLLRNKSEGVLLAELKNLRGGEQKLVVRIISYLCEVERRRLHLDRGYSSMFTFCTEFLGYSEAEAHIRIQAARLSVDVPELASKIESGQISLSVAAMAQSAFRAENKKRKEKGESRLNNERKMRVVEELQQCSKTQAHKKLTEIFQIESLKKKAWIEIDENLDRKLEELKGLLAHKNFDGDLTKLVTLIADIALVELRKDKPADLTHTPTSHVDKARQESMGTSLRQTKCEKINSAKRSRYISIKIRREVWQRDQGRCSYRDPISGKQCGGVHGLEVDHIHEFAKGGSNELANLTLLCSAHNKHKSGSKPRSP